MLVVEAPKFMVFLLEQPEQTKTVSVSFFPTINYQLGYMIQIPFVRVTKIIKYLGIIYKTFIEKTVYFY